MLQWSRADGVDRVIETVGGDNLNLSLQAVKIGGTINFIGLIAGRAASVGFVTTNVTIHGIETGSRAMYEELAAFIEGHGVQPVIDSTLPISEVAEALAHHRSGRHFGKIVLTLSSRSGPPLPVDHVSWHVHAGSRRPNDLWGWAR